MQQNTKNSFNFLHNRQINRYNPHNFNKNGCRRTNISFNEETAVLLMKQFRGNKAGPQER